MSILFRQMKLCLSKVCVFGGGGSWQEKTAVEESDNLF